MSDSLMFNNDAYVLLETNQPERLLTPAEMFDKLKEIIVNCADDLPADVQQIGGIEDSPEERLRQREDNSSS